MNTNNFTEYNLPKSAYASFDATSLKDLIIERLNESQVFKDQNFEGSNINAFIDVVAYMYHVLLFYLNNTSSESTFTTAELYENINRLVSNLGYKPTGNQTSLATINLSAASNLPPNTYTIKRFSTIIVNAIPFTSIKDITFDKINTGNERVNIDNNTLYQGVINEYPPYTATGESFEVVTIVNNTPIQDTNSYVADNSFSLFVRNVTNSEWEEWFETSSLFLESPTALRYEKRLNGNGHYEFKFGNNIHGRSLKESDIVQIYFIQSSGNLGIITANTLAAGNFAFFNTPTFNDISSYIYDSSVNQILPSQLQYITANNTNNSSPISNAETVEEIRSNAPKIFATQNRLVTGIDYRNFIESNYNNIIKSVRVLDNIDYTNKFLKYYYSIGLNQPNNDARVLFNQVAFSNSTSFNNVYLFCVPKTSTILNEQIPNYLNFTQKQLVINECSSKKDITHNVVCVDPIYQAFDVGLRLAGEDNCIKYKDTTALVIRRSPNSRISNDNLRTKVSNEIKMYFDQIQLGQVVDINTLTNNILNIVGVGDIYTRRTDTGFQVPKISMVLWNPIYEDEDVRFTTQNHALEQFQYAYFYEISNLKNKIIIENE